MNMKSVLLIILTSLFSIQLCGGIQIVQNGQPQGAIIVGSQPTRAAQFAAFELQYWISKITGARLPIRAVPQKDDKVRLIVGFNEHSKKLGIKPFQKEEYQLAFKGNDVILAGNDAPDYGKVDYQDFKTFPSDLFCYRSTTYAVYDFLEKFCGVRFYTYGENGVCFSSQKTLEVSGTGYRRMPSMDALRYSPFGSALKRMKVSPRDIRLLMLRWRMNCMYGLTNHSTYGIYPRYWDHPVDKRFQSLFREKRPEYFAKRKPGSLKHYSTVYRWFDKKNPPPSQLCYSQPGVLEYFTDEAVQVYSGKKVPGGYANVPRMAGQPFYYPFQEDDDNFWCECEQCTALRSKGNHAWSHFNFVNKLAKSVAAKDKNIGISTLAYSQSLPRPKNLPLEDNIAVQMCYSIQSWYHPQIYNFQHSIYKDWVRAEGKKRPLLLWLYLLCPSHEAIRIYKYNKFFPVLYPQHTGQYFKEFLNDGINGWFGEVDLQRHPLEAYIACKLSFDSSLDPKQLLNEYYQMYYGAAGKDMQAFYETLENYAWDIRNYSPRVRAMAKTSSFIYGLHTERDNWHLGSAAIMEKLDKLVRSALQNVKTPQEKQRMQRFMDQIWQQAVEGRKEFEVREKARAVAYPELTVRSLKDADNELDKIDFSVADQIRNWSMQNNKPSAIPAEAAMAYDANYLYIYFHEKDSYAHKNRNESIWENGLELFLSEKRDSDYMQIVISPKGESFVYESVNVSGVQRFSKKSIPCKVVSNVTPDSWTLKFSLPIGEIFHKKVVSDARIYGNLFRTKSVNKMITSYMWSTIFTNAYSENLYRMGTIYFQKPPQEGVLPTTLKGEPGTLPQNWKYVPDKQGQRKLEFDGKTLKIENTGNKSHWAFVYWNERFPCQPGDEITYTFTASGSGSIYCETLLLHWHGDWSGAALKTLKLSALPEQYTVTIKVPPMGKRIKRQPMEFRPMFGVQEKMEISDLTVKLHRK